ncbi:hypothetical protein ACFWJS_33620 [Streptomyces sp. NPDC127061]|uniref:hypothetical protein n=1 Tax=Streptomyces sp. NPDC127061 TaxID=3347122 RepID=UPI0036643F26
MAALATLDALVARLGRPLDDDAETALAEAALDDASDLVRHYGLPWAPETCPAIVRRVVLRAAERIVRNPENARMEMEGSYQISLPASLPVSGELTDEERAIVEKAAGFNDLVSMRITRFDPAPCTDTVYVEPEGPGEFIPFFAPDDIIGGDG